eukprot:scaffold33117_cov75-Cyclotella_meneghiniana.AAC.1
MQFLVAAVLTPDRSQVDGERQRQQIGDKIEAKPSDAAADVNVDDGVNSVWGLETVGPLQWPSQGSIASTVICIGVVQCDHSVDLLLLHARWY